MKGWYLVCYDIRDDRRLRRVAKVLCGFGVRLQYSVFRCHLSERDIERLRWELTQESDENDAVLYVPLCAGCVSRLRERDSAGSWPEEPAAWAIL